MPESYIQKRYRTDKEFREKVKKQANQRYKNNRAQIIKTWREQYANRTPEQIQARTNYLKKLRSSKTKLTFHEICHEPEVVNP